jgi:hypothetical protein
VPTTQKSGIAITNLTPALRALRKLSPDAHKELKIASRKIADQLVTRAQSRATTPQARKAARSLRARGGDQPTVALGGASAPFALGAEFGGGAYYAGHPTERGGYTSQFAPWRGSGKSAGYFLYPTVRAERGWIGEAYAQALDRPSSAAPGEDRRNG